MTAISELQLVALLHRLAGAGVDFVVIGGVAVAVQGYGRSTKDLDITYATNAANLERLGRALIDLAARLRGVDEEVPFVPDAPTLRRMAILTLDTSEGPLDLLVRPDGAAPYEQLRARADVIDLDGAEIRVVDIDDLLAMKRAAGRPQDLADIDALEAVKRVRRNG
ncbi:nucleotidyl transferase AbiEii/AbiGii toxin family protein [Conexibacter stalactiti]|uniref:Nucleotidyl transferase AbiEii/AbiGii toxin family protein n=1 Tax=Conexibacter stalactiti TaxID=1940611 RepID=A0ABU4HSW8_9ACTN|nr:nucleotidyl transferase AbiEii/AbiGii toxin family protein [Conexibacter stalactiti]MDW5595625.1 nucleotidyl transferase AbiEii/AbiGii toxin family protein [Conexibacter stalactiti]MEC5036267.1 nucleotidyl transferase AbiEii/AbiGii toxin family protein [Conexibacter stalactiti]